MDIVKPSRWASAYRNSDFYLVETWSGYRGALRDPEGRQHALAPAAEAQALGAALTDALACSRFLLPDQFPDFFDLRKAPERHTAWVDKLMNQYGYNTKRALFKNMALCQISLTVGEGPIRIRPMRHDTLEGWVGAQNDGVEDVFLSVDSTPEKMGQGLLLAFTRCT